MPLFNTFTGSSARALGNISAEPPGQPVLTATASAIAIRIDFTFSNGAFPVNAIEYRYKLTSGSFGTWYSISPELRTINLTGLETNTSYTYEVRVKDNAQQYGLTASGVTSTTSEVAPSAVSSLSVSPTGTTQLTVQFGPSTAGTYPIQKYQYRIGSGSYIDTPVSANVPFNVTSLSPETSYSITVIAVAATSGTTSNTTSASATTDPTVPAVPTISWSRMTSSDRTTAKLAWNNVATSGTGTVTYYVEANEVNDAEQVIAQVGVFTTTNTTIDITVSEGKNYRFYVRAYNRLSQNNGPSYRGALTTGRSNVYWSLLNVGPIHVGRQRVADGSGAIIQNLQSDTASDPAAAWYRKIDKLTVYVKRAVNSADQPGLTHPDFGNTLGLQFMLMSGQNGTGTANATWAFPSSKTPAQGFNVIGELTGTSGGVTSESPFIINNVNVGGSSINGGSIKVTANGASVTRFSYPSSNYGNFADGSNNLIAAYLFVEGTQNTGTIYN
jgi:hypothetical protein